MCCIPIDVFGCNIAHPTNNYCALYLGFQNTFTSNTNGTADVVLIVYIFHSATINIVIFYL